MNKALRWKVLKRDDFTCQYCGRNATERYLHVDHVFPQSKGGPDDERNLVTSCVACNLGKSDGLLDDRVAQLVDLPEMPPYLQPFIRAGRAFVLKDGTAVVAIPGGPGFERIDHHEPTRGLVRLALGAEELRLVPV